MKLGSKELIETSDGTFTLYSKEFDECYHSSKDGALRESLNKHIIPAFSLAYPKSHLRVLDICFGLGYNTLATIFYLKSNRIKKSIEILSPEFDKELVKSLVDFNYPKEFEPLKPIIKAISQNGFYKDKDISIELFLGDAREFIKRIDRDSIDIVYQDPFSPKKNPLLWTREYFRDLKAILNENAILTTYSSATPVRMGLYENGFYLYEPPFSGVRLGTIASLCPLELKEIDMELKIKRSSKAFSLRDSDFI